MDMAWVALCSDLSCMGAFLFCGSSSPPCRLGYEALNTRVFRFHLPGMDGFRIPLGVSRKITWGKRIEWKRSIKGAGILFIALRIFCPAKAGSSKQRIRVINLVWNHPHHSGWIFQAVMEEPDPVFMSCRIPAPIITSYKPEADCFKDFFRDSANRPGNRYPWPLQIREEIHAWFFCTPRPGWDKIADAIVLVNSKATIHFSAMSAWRQQLLGNRGMSSRSYLMD